MGWIKYTIKLISVFLLFMVIGFYSYYRYKRPHPKEFYRFSDYHSRELIERLGGRVSTSQRPCYRKQHFLNFSPQKESNTIRIGTFGDSFTYGSEVGYKETYPYYLQQLFNEYFASSLHKVEVLNFGLNGHGFQEQFFLWEHYSEKYELDYILMGPSGFEGHRDVDFIKIWETQLQAFPKDKYVLKENNDIHLMTIKGDSLDDKYSNFYSLWPTLTALKYSKKPFIIYEYFFPFLRGKLSNPFYYSKLNDLEESFAINRILIQKIHNKHPKKIFTINNSKRWVNKYRNIQYILNLNLVKPNTLFLYRYSHTSSLANEFFAKVYLNAMIGKNNFYVKLLDCYFKHNEHRINHTINLMQIKDIQLVDIRGKEISVFRNNFNPYCLHSGKSSSVDIKKNWIRSFVNFVVEPEEDFNSLLYLPLAIDLQNKMPMYLVVPSKPKILIGYIKSQDAHGKFFTFHQKYFRTMLEQPSITRKIIILDQQRMPAKFKTQIEDTDHIKLMVKNHTIGVFKRVSGGTFELRPSNGYQTSFLFMGGTQTVESDFPDTPFPLFIKYLHDSGQVTLSKTSMECNKKDRVVKLNLDNFQPLPRHNENLRNISILSR